MLHRFPGGNITTTFQGTHGMEWKTHMKCVKRLSSMTLNQTMICKSTYHDEDTDEETKFVVFFATKPRLSFLNQGNTLHTSPIGWCGMDPKDTQTQEWLPNESYDSLWSNRKN